jgi:starch-binding outer membrane protein, SusD/RagB family
MHHVPRKVRTTITRSSRRLPRLIGFAWLATTGGCGGLTSVDAPDVIQPPDVASPAGANALRVGAVASFYTWLGSNRIAAGSTENMVNYAGLLSDELVSGLDPAANTSIIDARRLSDPSSAAAQYSGLHQARVAALKAIAALQQYAPTPAARIGELFAFDGLSRVWFAEFFCSGVPLSTNAQGAPVYGPSLTTQQMLESALPVFDSALAYGQDSSRITALAQVGKGRALVDLGRFAEAASAVASVPDAYTSGTEHSAAVQPNGIAAAFALRRYGVADLEGGTGLNFVTANDSRIPTALVGKGSDNVTDIYSDTRITTTTPIPLASGVEARLIEAEAALQAGDVSGWLAALNRSRSIQGLPPLSDPGSASARVDLQFRERAFSLFLTGHRLEDLRRLVRQYGRPQSAVFPAGVFKDGAPRGSDVNFLIPTSENNNPNFRGCLDRNP